MSKNTKNTNKKVGDNSNPSALQRNLSDGPFHLVIPDFNDEDEQVATSTGSSSNIIRKYPSRASSSTSKISRATSSSTPKISAASSSSSTPASKIPQASFNSSSSITASALANVQIKIPNIRLPKSCVDLPKIIPQPLENEAKRGKFQVTILNYLLTNVLRYTYEKRFIFI